MRKQIGAHQILENVKITANLKLEIRLEDTPFFNNLWVDIHG